MAPTVSDAVFQAGVSLFTFVDASKDCFIVDDKKWDAKNILIFPEENIAWGTIQDLNTWDRVTEIMLKHRTYHQLIAAELGTGNFKSVQVISNCQPCYHPLTAYITCYITGKICN